MESVFTFLSGFFHSESLFWTYPHCCMYQQFIVTTEEYSIGRMEYLFIFLLEDREFTNKW